jgi:hypothetical protein
MSDLNVPPVYVEIYPSKKGGWGWSADFDATGLDQKGVTATFAEAVGAVLAAVANAQIIEGTP